MAGATRWRPTGYIRDTGDDRVVDEPALADTLYLSAEDLEARKDKRVPLYSTEVSPSGAPAAFPFTLHANAVTASALDILRRTLDVETARGLQDPDSVRAAIGRHFLVEDAGRSTFASAIALAGSTSVVDDPAASALWFPVMRPCRGRIPTIGAPRRRSTSPELARATVRATHGPDARSVLQWLRRAPLDGGIAAEAVDADGRAAGNGGDASLSGLLAWSVWYAINALGERP